MSDTRAELLQRAYYASTAAAYDEAHLEAAEHRLGLQIMLAAIRHYEFGSVLDVGSGTGRALTFVKNEVPTLRVVGIELSPELRAIGYRKGLTPEDLQHGDALHLPFGDESFDLVCEFSALHHIARPAQAISEMLRVARRGIFISDTNNFGQGPLLVRLMKQALNAVGLWPLADWVKTGGRGYSVSEGDGVAYSYSVFNDWPQITRQCRLVHVVNTDGGGMNPYRTAAHVAVLGLKA
ncbi:MAG TPA: class I SAM-dependent methyltransferase [Vicinamibacterales bacterium]